MQRERLNRLLSVQGNISPNIAICTQGRLEKDLWGKPTPLFIVDFWRQRRCQQGFSGLSGLSAIYRHTVIFKWKNSAENSEDVKILLIPSKTFFFEIFDTYIFVNYLPLLGNVKNGSNSFQFDKLHSFPFILKSDFKICHLFFQSFFSPL